MLNRFYLLIRYLALRVPSSTLAVAGTYWDYRRFFHNFYKPGAMRVPRPESATGRRYFEKLEADGIYVVDGFWNEQRCSTARAEVDRLVAQYPGYLHSNAKSDMRIYGANNVSSVINEFAEDPVLKSIATAYNRESSRTAFTLAARMPFLPDNRGSGDGWHRDAFLRQFKAILYLSDVTLDNGPFQFIKHSHERNFVLRDILLGHLRYMQYRLSESQIGRILENGPERLTTYTAKAGTLILVDTSSIHRGMPIRAGARYALTNYYYPEDRIDSALYEKFNVVPA